MAEGEDLTDDDLNMDWFDFAQKKEIIWVGSPDYVAEKIAHLQEESGLSARDAVAEPGVRALLDGVSQPGAIQRESDTAVCAGGESGAGGGFVGSFANNA